jgi:predicted phosphate transport protein (TIGR00153 family)
MDKVPNHAESSVRMIIVQHISIPDFLCEGLERLTDVTCRCVDAMLDSAKKLFAEYTGATVAVGKIDESESESDRLESELIDRIFTSRIDGTHKILLRDLVQHLAEISDKAENVGDRIRIICSKRSL